MNIINKFNIGEKVLIRRWGIGTVLDISYNGFYYIYEIEHNVKYWNSNGDFKVQMTEQNLFCENDLEKYVE